MSLSIIALKQHHLDEAAQLFAAEYRAQQRLTPALPTCHESPRGISALLGRCLGKAPGVAALREGELVGFAQSIVLPECSGRRAAYLPEWAHAVGRADPVAVYRAMYNHLARRWIEDRCSSHAVTLLCLKERVIRELFHYGFGLLVADAVRDLSPIAVPANGIAIRPASTDDVGVVVELQHRLNRHLAAGPIFRMGHESPGADEIQDMLANPDQTHLLAYHGRNVIGYMGFGPVTEGVSHIVRDEKSAACIGAYVDSGLRRRGIGTALLSRGVEWAKGAGFKRCTVDFESANAAARQFWLKHFDPVTYSMVRTVDDRTIQP